MYKQLSIMFFFILIFVTNLHAQPDNWDQQLYNSIYFAENGNDIIVDLEQIKISLFNRANPNWIVAQKNKEESILSRYVQLISLAKNQETLSQGIEAIQLLLKNKAKLQYCDGSILFWPITQGKYEIVKILLENGADASFWPKDALGDSYNFTPIEQAIADGHDSIVNLLIEHGATKPNEKHAVKLRLIESAKFGTVSELKEQIVKGVDINSRNINGETVLINALNGIYGYETYLKIIYILDAGGDPNLKGVGTILGNTIPLNEAVLMSSFLFKAKKRDKSYAEQILKVLIKKGAYISGTDDSGQTPLHIAAKYNNLYAAQLLINSGSKVMPKDKMGKTPLSYAQSAEMIKLLKKYGATEQ